MTRARPQARLNEFALVGRVGVKAALLLIGDGFEAKSREPYKHTDDGKQIQPLPMGCRNGHKRSRRCERDP
jgi:hypothetical protein